MTTTNTATGPFEYTDGSGRRRVVAVEPDASQDEREAAACEARRRDRIGALGRAIRAMYEAGERRELAIEIRMLMGSDI